MAEGDALRATIARKGPYVHLEGGPYDGANYTVADWRTTREAEHWGLTEAAEQRPKVMGLYQETKRLWSAHHNDKAIPALTATVWRWTGAVEPVTPGTARGRRRY